MTKNKKVDLFNFFKIKKNNIPVFLDKVSAGFPSPASDYIENKLNLNEYLIKNPPATFIVKAQGLSMIEANIKPNDLLIVDRSLTPINNHIVIASIFGDLTVKKLKKRSNITFLVSANTNYPSIQIKEEMDCFIWGVVTFIIHDAKI
ncbi:MAG: LexA repressor [Alphaproteobacteria bacterium MarineAlpha5_Bin9]|nr:MAG: LexA repressor [Alphaproteobacteria bacterium MarineAlpha5_Bin9]